ncbi:MAG: hypothetical protein CMK08_14495 [Ponticaulis sp.]|nr:hypothetical protein [Ponticaulis sp.]MBN05371.1 hypothetical protein [Ponticaulis sp.]|tara:strand:+ start:219 stop:458 length:240 start_codon:yes stop_codon:yes gene_type:complete
MKLEGIEKHKGLNRCQNKLQFHRWKASIQELYSLKRKPLTISESQRLGLRRIGNMANTVFLFTKSGTMSDTKFKTCWIS